MVPLLWVFRCLLLVLVVRVVAVPHVPVQLSHSFGGLDGMEFSDQSAVSAGQTIGSISIRAGDRVYGVVLEVTGPTATTLMHGGSEGKLKVLQLEVDEYITSMEVHWGEIDDRTLIFYLRFRTSAGNSVSGGSMTTSRNRVRAPEGFQLGGFFGRESDVMIDNLGAIWTRISTKYRVTEPSAAAASGPASSGALGIGRSAAESSERSVDSSTGSMDPAETKREAALAGSAEVSVEATPAKQHTVRKVPAAESSTRHVVSSADESSFDDFDVSSTERRSAIDTISTAADSASMSTDGSSNMLDANVPATESSTRHVVHSAEEPSLNRLDIASTEDPTAASDVVPAVGLLARSAADPADPSAAPVDPAADPVDPAADPVDPAADPVDPAADPSAAPIDPAIDPAAAPAAPAVAPPADPADPADPSADPVDPAAPPADPSAAPVDPVDPADPSAAPEDPAASPGDPAASSAETEAQEGPVMTLKDSIVLSESFGASSGDDFSDQNLVNSGQTVKSISVYAGKRLDGIMLTISAPKTLTFTHGGTGGERKELELGEGERINSMEVNWGKKNGRTRIFYVNFLTSAGNSLSGGSMTDDKSIVTAPEGFQLAGFFGKAADEIDSLGAIWAYIDLVTPAPAPAPAAITLEDSPGTVAPADIAGSLSEVKAKVNKRAVQLSDSFGGPHGTQFSDQLAITSGMTIASVTIRAGARVDGVMVKVSAPKEMIFTHGAPSEESTLTLEPGEYITTMEAHWGKRNDKTRIFYLSLGTNKGNTVSGGTKTDLKGSVTAPRGYQLAGFFGRDGDSIDHLGAVWSSIAAMNETIAPPVSGDDDIVLSELYGGPHGTAFSDINKIKFGQTISSVTIRSARRLDAVTLQISTPATLTLNHGAYGGNETTLVLAPDEVITSVEVHWAKKDKHTKVFYICFTTSAGNTLAGGTQTDNKGTAMPPEGFVLSGFYGRAGDEVDQLGVIWTRKTAKDILLTDPSGVGNGTYGPMIRNWVGPSIGQSTDTACYRKTVAFDSTNTCPLGYENDHDDCIVQCPMAYPVECSMECIPQNDDCALAILTKIGSVVAVALNVATAGVFAQVYEIYKKTKWAVMCVTNLVEVARSLTYYLRYRQTTAPQGNTAELLAAVYQADVVLYDLPIAICTCMNIPVPANARFGQTVLIVVEAIVKQAITNGDEIISTGANVISLLTGTGVVNESKITVDEVDDLISKNSSCGYELKRLTDRVTRAVLRYRSTGASVNDIRVKVYESLIVRNDIPTITNNCMGELLATKTVAAAYETRDLLRKTFAVIVDQLIDTGKTDNGKNVAESEYMLEVANMGLIALSTVDPTGIAYMASQFVQPICGPTAYIGEIDDGTLNDALGLKTADEAFAGSYGTYTNAGDGIIHIIFESVDTRDVTVVIHSGGDDHAEVDVGAGDTVVWDSTFPELEDKTLYLDRWRPGIFDLPGSGGGSLLLWIPRSSEGGHITMHVRINPS